MIALLANAIEAHGGLHRWNARKHLTATVAMSGDLWDAKGVDQNRCLRTARIDLHRGQVSIEPFGKPGQRSKFSAERVAIVAADERIVAERKNPRASFARHDMRTHWDLLHRAYFDGCALWTCMTTPFLLAMDGFEAHEIEPWREGGEIWRGLRATFPSAIASHSVEQDFYFGPDMLIQRHDYRVEIAGNFPVAQYGADLVSVEGINVPTRWRAYLRDDSLTPMLDTPMVSIDLSDLRFD